MDETGRLQRRTIFMGVRSRSSGRLGVVNYGKRKEDCGRYPEFGVSSIYD